MSVCRSDFIEQCGLLHKHPISELGGLRIGVDGHKWLSTLGVTPGAGIDEPFVSRTSLRQTDSPLISRLCSQLAVGGCPLSLPTLIAQSLEQFKWVRCCLRFPPRDSVLLGRAANIRPLMIFNGLPIKRLDPKPKIYMNASENVAQVNLRFSRSSLQNTTRASSKPRDLHRCLRLVTPLMVPCRPGSVTTAATTRKHSQPFVG